MSRHFKEIATVCATIAFGIYEYHQAAIRQKAEIIQMELEAIKHFKNEVISEKPHERMRIAAFYARISSDAETRQRWNAYKTQAENEIPRYIAYKKQQLADAENRNTRAENHTTAVPVPAMTDAEEKKALAAELDAFVSEDNIMANAQQWADIGYAKQELFLIAPRVFFHIPADAGLAANTLVAKGVNALKQTGAYAVQGTKAQAINRKAFPDDTQIRYFNKAREEDARRLQYELKAAGIDARINYLPDLADNHHLEVWVTGD